MQEPAEAIIRERCWWCGTEEFLQMFSKELSFWSRHSNGTADRTMVVKKKRKKEKQTQTFKRKKQKLQNMYF